MEAKNKNSKVPKPSYSTPSTISQSKEEIMRQIEEKAAQKEFYRLRGDTEFALKIVPSEFYPDQREIKTLTIRTTARIKGLLDLVARKEKETDRQNTMYNIINDALSKHILQKLEEYGYDISTLHLP